jgi:hypothetical protein
MKRLVLFVVALVFALSANVMAVDKAAENTGVVKDEAQVKAVDKKAKANAKKKAVAKKAKKKAVKEKPYEPFIAPE